MSTAVFHGSPLATTQLGIVDHAARLTTIEERLATIMEMVRTSQEDALEQQRISVEQIAKIKALEIASHRQDETLSLLSDDLARERARGDNLERSANKAKSDIKKLKCEVCCLSVAVVIVGGVAAIPALPCTSSSGTVASIGSEVLSSATASRTATAALSAASKV